MNSTIKKVTIIISSLFFIGYFVVRYYFENKVYKAPEGIWVTKEADGNDFEIQFYSSDSLLIIKDLQIIKKKYRINSNELQIFEDDSVEVRYNYQLINDKLILTYGKDTLVFHRN